MSCIECHVIQVMDLVEARKTVLKLRFSELKTLLSELKYCTKGKKQALVNKTLHLLNGKKALHVASKILDIQDQFKSRTLRIPDMSVKSYEVVPHSSQDSHSPRSNKYSLRAISNPPTYCENYNPSSPVFPVHPDVVLRTLPFYSRIGEILKPSSLIPYGQSYGVQEKHFVFHLTPQQCGKVSNSYDFRSGTNSVQVQLRFCLAETSCAQDDRLPPKLSVWVNKKYVQLPPVILPTKVGVAPKQQNLPIDITTRVCLSPTMSNTLDICWLHEAGAYFCASIYLVEKKTSADLVKKLRDKGVRNSEHTKALIKERLETDKDSEISTTSLRVSLLCPLGQCVMTHPCRAVTCSHVQCFDATLYLQMNEKRPTWTCPICDKTARYENLFIDGYFFNILRSTNSSTCNDIELHIDGSWTYLESKKAKPQAKVDVNSIPEEIILDDEDSSNDVKFCAEEPNVESVVVEVIDLASDTDSDVEIDDQATATGSEGKESEENDTVSEEDNEPPIDVDTPLSPPACPLIIDNEESCMPVDPSPVIPDREPESDVELSPTRTPPTPECILLGSPSASPSQFPPVVTPSPFQLFCSSLERYDPMSFIFDDALPK